MHGIYMLSLRFLSPKKKQKEIKRETSKKKTPAQRQYTQRHLISGRLPVVGLGGKWRALWGGGVDTPVLVCCLKGAMLKLGALYQTGSNQSVSSPLNMHGT